MSKPAKLPIWATDATFTSGVATGDAVVVEPSLGYKHQGLVPGADLIGEYLNWDLNNIYSWASYLNGLPTDIDFVGEDFDFSGDVTLSGNALVSGPSLNITASSFAVNTTQHNYGDIRLEDSTKFFRYAVGQEPHHTRYLPPARGRQIVGADFVPGIQNVVYPGSSNACTWCIDLNGMVMCDSTLESVRINYDLGAGAGTYTMQVTSRDPADTFYTPISGAATALTVGTNQTTTLTSLAHQFAPYNSLYYLYISCNGSRTLTVNNAWFQEALRVMGPM